MLVDQCTVDGQAAPVDQRAFLRRMTDALAGRNARLEVAFENEFALAGHDEQGALVPIDRSLCFSTIGMTAAQDYVDALIAALDAQAIPLEQYYAELGHGQQEISTAHRPALRAADEQILVRETIRAVAAGQELVASLAPKPWPEGAGNGCHVHFSLWDLEEDRNRFHDPAAPDGFSTEGRAFLAGVLEHLPGLCGLTAPSFNSYRRIVPQYWAGAYTCWGHDNREAPLRLPSQFRGMEEASTNVELKAADATSNPYLAIGGVIAAGLDGLERGLQPPDPVEVDPATLTDERREALAIRRLPATQAEALDALEADAVLTGALRPVLAASYLAVRRSEWETYSAETEAFEQQGHFLKY
jgi:glutamine synthetase